LSSSGGLSSAGRPALTEMPAIARRIRRYIITMLSKAGSGHPGGSLSAVEIVTALYYQVMRHRPEDPGWEGRDRFVLSKGHAAPVLYAVLADCGYFPVEELLTLRQLDSRLQGHAERTTTPGVEMSSGSLGQGLSFSIGVALAGRLNGRDYRTFVLLGDGECDEGQVWEAAMAAPHYGLDRLTAIIDHNGLQIDGFNCDVMNLEPLGEKWAAFGWRVMEVDGHDYPQLLDALARAGETRGQPTVIIARTVKGKGVSFMENKAEYHGKVPGAEQMQQALKELA